MDFLSGLIFTGALVLLVILLNIFINWKATGQAKKKQKQILRTRENAAKKGLLISCPLCNSLLLPGEDLVSRVYRPMNVSDQLCTINGCPHCYPRMEPGVKRECPVCHRNVPLGEGHLVARLFNKTDGKKHVIVTGCSECSKGVK